MLWKGPAQSFEPMGRSPLPDASLIALAARLERLEGLVSNTGFVHRKDLLQRYQTTYSSLHRWLRAGKLPAPVRFSGPLWRLADLEAAELNGQLPSPNGGQSIPIVHLFSKAEPAGNGGCPAKLVRLSDKLSCPAVRK